MQQFAYLCELALKITHFILEESDQLLGGFAPQTPTGASALDPTGGSRPQTPAICSPRKIFLATPL